MSDFNITEWAELWAIAKRRGIPDPQNCRVVCADCAMEPQPGLGISHFEDCEMSWDRILFLKKDSTGEWVRQGSKGSILQGLGIFTVTD